MSRLSRACSVCAVAVALALPAPAASASAYSDVLQTYEQSGTIPPCKFSGAELSSALKGVDTYGAQYFADFTDAIDSALAGRASGQCSSTSAPQQVAPAGVAQPPSSRTLPIGPVTAATDAGLPLPILLLALLAGSAALAATLRVAWGRRGQDPAWVAGWQHAWSEAGYRAGGMWSEFRDWLRSA